MSNLIVAAKQAVEAMKFELKIDRTDPDESLLAADKLREAIASLEKAIAEAEKQEPVAWMFKGIAGFKTHITDTQYQSLHQEEKKWYEPYKCVNCTHSQPKTEQEPVAWMNAITKEIYWRNQINSDVPNVPLYTHPQLKREWVGLTDEEIIRIKAAIKGTLDVQFGVFARAIEAKLKEKNT